MTRREENRAKKRKYHINKLARRAKNQRIHAAKPHTLEYVEGDLISEANDLRGLLTESRGHEAIPAFRDFLTVWNDHAHNWNNRAALEKAAKLVDFER